MKRQHISTNDEPLRVSAGVIRNSDGAVLIARRKPEAGPTGGLWEFPGGKIEPGEQPRESLVREIREELGVDIEINTLICIVKKDTDNMPLELIVFEAMITEGDPKPLEHDELAWVMPPALDETGFPEPDKPIIRFLKSGRRTFAARTAALSH